MKKWTRALAMLMLVCIFCAILPAPVSAAAKKPAAPTVTVTNYSDTGKIKVKWNAVTYATTYEVYRSTGSSGTYKKIASTKNLYYKDTSVSVGKTYYYKVRAMNGSTAGKMSSVVSATCRLARPSGVKVSADKNGRNVVTWSAVSYASKYGVFRATSKNGTYKKIKTTTSRSFNDTTATAGVTYYYKIRAYHSSGNDACSAYSAVVSCEAMLPTPSITVSLSGGKPAIKWKHVKGAYGYAVARSTSKNGDYKIIGCLTDYYDVGVDDTAKKGVTYYYTVAAIDYNSYRLLQYGDASSSYYGSSYDSNIVSCKATK